MADRYKNAAIVKNSRGKRVFETTLYPKIEVSDSDIYITSKSGDRLDNLAYRFYGDVSLWWIIAQANYVGNGSMIIPGGIQLRIPQDLTKIFSDLKDINVSG